MEGMVIAGNSTMLGLARRLGFTVNAVSDDATMLRVEPILWSAHPGVYALSAPHPK